MVPIATVSRDWPDATVVCLGGGPSLTREDVASCRGRARVIAVNDAHRIAPWADVLYAADAAWWNLYAGVPSFEGRKYTISPKIRMPEKPWLKWSDVQVLQNTGPAGLEHDPSGLRTGKNSGYQAINLAVHFGARRILLLGYDMRSGGEGRSHWFGDHPSVLNSRENYGIFLEHFRTLVDPLRQLGIEVVNCSRSTRLTCFPRAALRDVVQDEVAA